MFPFEAAYGPMSPADTTPLPSPLPLQEHTWPGTLDGLAEAVVRCSGRQLWKNYKEWLYLINQFNLNQASVDPQPVRIQGILRVLPFMLDRALGPRCVSC